MTASAWRGVWLGVALSTLVTIWPSGPAGARTAEVYVVVRADLQRLQPSGPPDEPIEPIPSLQERVREAVSRHPAFREVTLRLGASEAPPNPRVTADFLKLTEKSIDEVVVVNVGYHLRLDNFRATGAARVVGHVAVYSVAARRQVASRAFTVGVSYPGDVSKEAVLQAELAAQARGAPVPIEQLELGLLDAAVKRRVGPELDAALRIYHPASLPQVSQRAIQGSMDRMARFLAQSPGRQEEAAQVVEQYLVRYTAAPERSSMETRLRELRQSAPATASTQAQWQEERRARGVTQTLQATELLTVLDRVTGSVVEVRGFTLWQESTAVWLRTSDQKQDFLLDAVPPTVWELEADPPAAYVMVVGRRPDPRFVDVKVPVLRWVGCPSKLCPGKL